MLSCARGNHASFFTRVASIGIEEEIRLEQKTSPRFLTLMLSPNGGEEDFSLSKLVEILLFGFRSANESKRTTT